MYILYNKSNVSNVHGGITSTYCIVPDLYLVETIECCKFNNITWVRIIFL